MSGEIWIHIVILSLGITPMLKCDALLYNKNDREFAKIPRRRDNNNKEYNENITDATNTTEALTTATTQTSSTSRDDDLDDAGEYELPDDEYCNSYDYQYDYGFLMMMRLLGLKSKLFLKLMGKQKFQKYSVVRSSTASKTEKRKTSV